MSHRKSLSLLYSVRYRRAVSLPLTSLVSHRKSLSLLLPPAAVLHLNSVRYRRAVSLPLTSLVSHRKSLSLFLPPAAVELVSPTDGGHYSSSVRSSHLTRSARDISQLTDKKSPSSRHWRRSITRPPVSYTHLDVYKRQAFGSI